MELAVVLAVVAILSVAVTAGLAGFQRAARSHRTATEMGALRQAAVDAFARGASYRTNCTASSPCATTQLSTVFDGVDVGPSSVCYDLSSSGWAPRTPSPPLQSVLNSGAGIPNGGRNAYGNPYAICYWRRLALVATCVPRDDIPSALAGGNPDRCTAFGAPVPATCPVTGQECITVSAALLPPTLAGPAMTYKYLYWGEATTAP